MKAKKLISVGLVVGILLAVVFGVVMTSMLRSARETHQAIARLDQIDDAVTHVMRLYASLGDLVRATDAVIDGRLPDRAILEGKLAAAHAMLPEMDMAAQTNPLLHVAGRTYPADLPATLDAATAFTNSLRDGRPIVGAQAQAGRDVGLRAFNTAQAVLETVDDLRRTSRDLMVARLRMWEVSSFWWLLIGANMMLIAIISTLGLLALVANTRRRTARELAEARSIAAAADVSRSRFLAAASHDLRQPLQAVTLFSAALRRRVSDPYVTSLIEGISSATTSLERMFNGLLDISKLDAGIVAAERADFPISRMLHNVEIEFAALAEAKGLGFTVLSNGVAVHTDPVLLESMVRNLVSNAIKYSQQGQVIVTCRHEQNVVVIEVCDTGSGISEDEQDRIFQEFHRVATPASTEEGLGLGLAIVRRLSMILGVEVGLRSILGIGSTFSLRVQAATVQAEQPAPSAISKVTAAAGPMRILLLDDDALLRRAMVEELSALGMSVSAFGKADDVLTFFAAENVRNSFDVVLMDFNLGPGPNGVEVLDRLAVQFSLALPALIMTGETSPDILEELGDSGYAWLQKPVSAEVVVDALARLLTASEDGGRDDLLSALQRSTEESGSGGKALAIS